jgi:D-alanyl-D-alanine carboxypeptidase (penicillin-binding protein 5/6)
MPRHLVNHNKLLWSYPGTVGGKTGYTRRAGHSLLTVANRGGRTLIAVLLNVPDKYGLARTLLDRSFATPPPVAPVDRLPPVRALVALRSTPEPAVVNSEPTSGPAAATTTTSASGVLFPSRPVVAASAAICMMCALAMFALVRRERSPAVGIPGT